MSALGQKQTSRRVQSMSALPPITDIAECVAMSAFVPKADISFGLEGNSSRTLYVTMGRNILERKLADRLDLTALSTASRTCGLMRIWPGFASSQS